jgi:hypothetical protein
MTRLTEIEIGGSYFELKKNCAMSCYGKILARYLADTGIGAGFILVTMIVATGLYRLGRGFFLSLRQLHHGC